MSLAFRMEHLDAFRVVGFSWETTNKDGEGMRRIPQIWEEMVKSGAQMEALSLMDQPPFGLIGMSVYNTDPTDNRKFHYCIGCSSSKAIPETMTEYTVPAAAWAVFPCAQKGDEQDLMMHIVTEWLPGSGYQFANSGYETGCMISQAPDMEIYMEDGSSEIWIAVK